MIDLSVPATVTAPFIVAAPRPVSDPAALARRRVRSPLAAQLLDSPLLRIRSRPVGESGYTDLLDAAAWVRPEERPFLGAVRHHLLITGHAPPVSQPGHGQAAREVARAVAESCDGIVYDAWSHQVLPRDFRLSPEHPEFCLADDWLATFVAGGADDGDAPMTGSGAGAGGPVLRLATAGLHRFGFPELEAVRVPAGNLSAAITLLRCLAVGLLDEHWDWLACHPGATTRSIPSEVWADGLDVWRYWAAEPAGPVGGRVRVRLSRSDAGPRSDVGSRSGLLPYLAAGPPADFDATAAMWWNDVVDLAMPYVPDAPRRTAA